MVKRIAAIALLTFALSVSSAAWACPVLQKAAPRVGSTVEGTVSAVTLAFSSPIFADKSTLTVTDAKGAAMTTGKPYGHDTTIAVRTKALPPGDYKVTYNVLCDCGDYTPGDFGFTVGGTVAYTIY